MNVRLLGVALVLALVGLAGGWAIGSGGEEPPAAIRAAEPVVGESPPFPSDPVVTVLPDPDTPALEPALELHDERMGSKAFGVRLPVPDGWVRTDNILEETKWEPVGAPVNTYLLRVKIISGLRLTVAQALAARRDALMSAVEELELESQTGDTFVATYVNDSYRRLTIERFLSLDGTDAAYVTVAVIGRERDRVGLVDLLERITDGGALSRS
ncbi:hypothetical protein NPS01_11250 [Nocardioides psychrotolerans]|uniref:Lipoprotein LpqN n=1 Tax=Nocardioides psychrotolerans TaxID=1005945 RepID=A0A1I3E9F3_9ACTN|nr:hypothetical protein [Nocardioides psychrotolerans]GEP37462.1 hypothetical protein NPS01_11250 [Nocardioides psychrotolerans]SFH95529.1 hypothetical protein SAMN05216561_103266 [Nocardioides psychrotolerans]